MHSTLATCPPTPLFNLGRASATRQALHALRDANIPPQTLLRQHQCGDWGRVDPHDAKVNDHSVRNGFRILSIYTLDAVTDTVVWVITEADRSSTLLLLPHEY